MLKRHWHAAALFLALAVILTNPLVLHLWNAVEDKQDALLNTWIMAWVGHASITDPLNLYNANIFYPYPNTLAFSEVLIPQGLLALPISLATDNPIFSYNLVLVAMLWLDACAMYLLVLDLTGSSEAGWVAGAIYAFNPFNLGNLAQIQLLSLGWLPLAFIFLRRLVNFGKSPPKARPSRTAFLFAFFFILQAFSSIYYALLAGIAVLICLLWFFRKIRRVAVPLLASSLLIALVLIPVLLPYFSVQRDLGFQRRVEESEPFSASLKQFTEVSPQNMLYGKWLAPNPVKRVGGYPLDNLFPGLVALLLAAIGLLRARSLRERGFLLILFLVALILSLGPRLYLNSQQATDLILPYRWLYESFAPMRALRAPVRFEALIMFALATLAGMGVWVLRARVKVRTGALAFGLVLLASSEYLALPAANTATVPVASEIPPVYRWLAEQPPGVVLELPMMGPNAQGQLDISKQYFTTYHWQKTPDGYSGFVPPRRGEIAYEMQFFAKGDLTQFERSVALLQGLNVRYLIVHLDEFTPTPSPEWKARLTRGTGLKLQKEFGNVAVYAVTARLPSQVVLPAGRTTRFDKDLFLPQPAPAGGAYRAFLIVANWSPLPYAIPPTEALHVTAQWSDGRVENLSVPLPTVISEVAVIPIPLHAPAQIGKYSLRLRSDDEVLEKLDQSGEVTVAEEGAKEVVIAAGPVGGILQPKPSYKAGDTVSVGLTWFVFGKVDAYYSVSVRVVDADGNKVVAVDRQPNPPTLLWEPEKYYSGDRFDLKLPEPLAPGKYRVQLLMYQGNDGTNVRFLAGIGTTINRQPALTLAEFQVK